MGTDPSLLQIRNSPHGVRFFSPWIYFYNSILCGVLFSDHNGDPLGTRALFGRTCSTTETFMGIGERHRPRGEKPHRAQFLLVCQLRSPYSAKILFLKGTHLWPNSNWTRSALEIPRQLIMYDPCFRSVLWHGKFSLLSFFSMLFFSLWIFFLWNFFLWNFFLGIFFNVKKRASQEIYFRRFKG